MKRKGVMVAGLALALIVLVVTGGFAGLVCLVTWDGAKAIHALSICAFAGLAAAMIWLATARLTGPNEIRDTVWAFLDIDGAANNQSGPQRGDTSASEPA